MYQYRLKSLLLILVCISLSLGAHQFGYRQGREDSGRHHATAIKSLHNMHAVAMEQNLDRLIWDEQYASAYAFARSMQGTSPNDSDRFQKKCIRAAVDRFNELMDAERYDDALDLAYTLREFPEIPVIETMLQKARLGCELQRRGGTGGIDPLAWHLR